ncbi:MAG: Clp protease N-terminal domain-containing protein, partial [Gammaproteobacteria bacterium]|nr:Clp protease N-terminal domain-containing protein [Gammaproteobacteria bacterium]
MLSSELEYCLNEAFQQARSDRHEYMTVEHLLLALLDIPRVAEILQAIGVELDRLRKDLHDFIRESTPLLATDDNQEVQPTLGFQRVLQRAVFHVQSSGKKEVRGDNVLVAMFGEKQSHAVYLLGLHNISRLDVVNYVSHGLSKTGDDVGKAGDKAGDEGTEEEASKSALDSFARNLNQMALDGKTDPLIGREAEIERTIQILCRRRKNNPLYVGEAGVGKTALAEGLAKMIVDDEVPKVLKGCTIYALDMGALLAG